MHQVQLGVHRDQGRRRDGALLPDPHGTEVDSHRPGDAAGHSSEDHNPMSNQLGKRYVCETCGSSVLCTKSGDGEITCCDATMEIQEHRKLPSSD